MTTKANIVFFLQQTNFISDTVSPDRPAAVPPLFWVTKRNFINKHTPFYTYIRIVLENAARFGVDAVYFRLFENRPPVPQIYICDYTEKSFSPENFAGKNKRIISSGEVPLVYVFTKTDIKIYNTFNHSTAKKNFGKEYKRFEYTLAEQIENLSNTDKQLKIKRSEEFKHFTADNFDNGSFWENQTYKNDFVVSKSAHETLIKYLKEIREKIKTNHILPDAISDKLLVMAIFVKYLEERKDENGNNVFPTEYFRKFNNSSYFLDVFDSSIAVIQLFRELSKHFNGEIFKLTESEENIISKKRHLTDFKDFLNENLENDRQTTIWKLYSFNDLPVELISNIYEEFIEDKSRGVVYTPPFLVNFLLDEVLPLTDANTNVKILDPACGSGIFLVQAYKRLIYRWRSKNNWKKPSKTDLQTLLKNNIYGVDENGKAILVAIFSLTLTLCDQLSPKEIWENLKFDNLKQKNLRESDFFTLVNNEDIDTDFDLVIGNPPFVAKLTDDAKVIENKRIANGKTAIPNSYALTFLFLEESQNLLNENGKNCLIVPADTFLHKNESLDFYNYFTEKHNTPLIIDFTPLRRILFPSATVATIAVFADKKKKISDEILHVVTKRTKTSREKTFFELDKYDFFKIPRKKSYKYRYLWKINLFGGGFRYFELAKKHLEKNFTFEDYLNNKQAEGIISKTNKGYPVLFIKKNIGEAPLRNKIFENNRKINKDDYFFSETVKIFSALQPPEGLMKIQEKIKNERDLYKFLILVISDRAALSRSASTILKKDIERLPFSDENYTENLQETEKILLDDVLNYYEDFIRKGENSKMVIKIPENEVKTILIDFAKTFLKTLNSVYDNYLAADYFVMKNHIVFPFYWGDKSRIPENISGLEKHLNQLLLENEHPQANLRFIRMLTIYDDNVFYLIKPRQYRYWLRSIALRDAGMVISKMTEDEYGI